MPSKGNDLIPSLFYFCLPIHSSSIQKDIRCVEVKSHSLLPTTSPSCNVLVRMLSTSVSFATSLCHIAISHSSGLFAPAVGQHFRHEQRYRNSQYDRGTSMAIRERDFDDTFRGGFIEFDQGYNSQEFGRGRGGGFGRGRSFGPSYRGGYEGVDPDGAPYSKCSPFLVRTVSDVYIGY